MTEPAAPKPLFWTTWKFWSAVLVIAIIGGLSYFYEDVKDEFPWLVSLQLWTYGKMSHAQARAPRPKWVVGVEVDNVTFFGEMKRKGPGDFTDRKMLAQIVDKIVDANPAVIALDINLERDETGAPANPDDDLLWKSLDHARQQQIPVVLTFGFDTKSMRPLGNVYGQDQVPICSENERQNVIRAGFDQAPEDLRKVPLVVDAQSPDGKAELECRSFALQIVDAFERRLGISPTSVERLAPSIEERQFAYVTFLPQSKFPRVSASAIYRDDPVALNALRHRIVLIGGNRTRWPTDNPHPPTSDMLDYFPGPEGPMAGMYFQANYVEGLLDDRVQSTIPRGIAALIDILLATAIILALNMLEGAVRVVAVVLLIVFPVLIAYTAMVTLGYSFDFVLPVILSFLHPALEKYIDLPEHLFRRKSHA